MSEQDVETIRGATATSTAATPAECWSGSTLRWPGSSRAAATLRPGPSTVRRASARTCSARIPQNFDEFTAEPDNYDDQGDTIVVTGRFKGKAKNGAGARRRLRARLRDEGRQGRAQFENKVDQEPWTAAWS